MFVHVLLINISIIFKFKIWDLAFTMFKLTTLYSMVYRVYRVCSL